MPLLLAKPPQPGAVKTRLIAPLTRRQAAEVHAAMLECVLARVPRHLPGPGQLALAAMSRDADAPVSKVEKLAEAHGWQVVGQGTGELGQRLDHVWRQSEAEAVVFLGSDSPDVPGEALAALAAALAEADAAAGPAADGGYWTLAARCYQPQLITGIDWGTDRVYDQTCAAASGAGLKMASVLTWYDVDTMGDLRRLRERLASASESPLIQLRDRLDTICGPSL